MTKVAREVVGVVRQPADPCPRVAEWIGWPRRYEGEATQRTCAVSEGHGRGRWLKARQQQLGGGGDHQRACAINARADP
jgi:hypothetical protein